MTQVYVDMDGVLADFDTHHETVFGIRADKLLDNVDWERVRSCPGFYADIPPMPDMRLLWDYVSRLSPKPIVLTGVPSSVEEAPANKRGWVKHHLGEFVEVRCCRSSEKCLHAKPGDVLIDDWDKYKGLWIAKGGHWITHRGSADTIDELIKLGIEPA